MAEHTYVCSCCENTFIRKYIISKPRNGKETHKKYCSKECRQAERKKERNFTSCLQCNTPIRVYPRELKENIKRYCSNKCQGNWVSENESEERAQRASHMREFRDNEEAWKKGLETRKENGNIITEHSWKQYWKKCDYLTRKLRKQMIQDWDGYDYIDGEYIRENLDLHYSHKRYPTLDHVVPRSECFKQGLTPEEATQPSNLKWTTRINNSKKHNKV
tara:strand:- start:29 stop:682 length:654 start_codon:yes stop_codon:yes gene_type:complete